MSRIVLFVLALFVLWRLLSALGKRAVTQGLGADSFSRFSPNQRRRRAEQGSPSPEELLECCGCGTFVPSGRALPGVDRGVYCSAACRDAASRESRHDQ